MFYYNEDVIRYYDLVHENWCVSISYVKVSVPNCYFKPTLNPSNFTIMLSSWTFTIILLFRSFNLWAIVTINCFSVLGYWWIISPKVINVWILLILILRYELFFGNLCQLLIFFNVDIEIKLGSKMKNQILLCHWNLIGLAAHNFTKVSLL